MVASTGDAGIGSTNGTASTDPWVIGVGGSTQLRSYAQASRGGFQLSNGKWVSDQVSALSSAGITQTNKVQDLIAPGDLGWSLCSKRKDAAGMPQYAACTNNNGAPSNLQLFGGTSESSPLTAGAAALVIQAYRQAHRGASPTPDLVRRILMSSADDLGLPADEQGAGLVDSYRAVQLARNAPGGAGSAQSGPGLLLGAAQLSSVSSPGAPVGGSVTVTNTGATAQQVTTGVRQVTKVTGSQTKTVALNAASTANLFTDSTGLARTYKKVTFTVPARTDRLDASIDWAAGVGATARLTLLDPTGTFTANSIPQGAGNSQQVDVHQPRAGTWTAIVYTSSGAAGFTGTVALHTTDSVATSAGLTFPSRFTLAPGASRTVRVLTLAPAFGATADALVVQGNSGSAGVVPVVTRAVAPVSPLKPARFSGTFDAANGRDYSPAQTFTYLFDVPAGARDLDVDLGFSGTPPNSVIAHLSDPHGEPIATDGNTRALSATTTTTDTGIQVIHAAPQAGVWQLTVELVNPVSGAALPQTFTGVVGLNRAKVVSVGVPNGASRVVSKTTGATATITVTNTSPQPQTYFVDPRLAASASYPLVAAQAATKNNPLVARVPLPLKDENTPAWLVPFETTRLSVAGSATVPFQFDVMALTSPTALNAPSAPDVEALSTGTNANAVHASVEVAPALWAAFPVPSGPNPPGGGPFGTVSMQAKIMTRAFATGIRTSTGDPLLGTVNPNAPASTPVTIPAGATATIRVTFAPTAAAGTVQAGTLYVDTLNAGALSGVAGLGDEVAAIPFTFRIGG